eukprot:CAMPEP_0119398890 /NCGR_PEP_ID=MMETSP1334-20130426/141079_1 /TAXON_ID=127549 /ORGANISM="Calcidiscus leptoporus, Strain RCC1130" /LENGTH=280 /DNA_ID=CAMNT_0007422771 /DNA_START=898 /DNA_END=1741 /DNA_ORIENTATION=-
MTTTTHPPGSRRRGGGALGVCGSAAARAAAGATASVASAGAAACAPAVPSDGTSGATAKQSLCRPEAGVVAAAAVAAGANLLKAGSSSDTDWVLVASLVVFVLLLAALALALVLLYRRHIARGGAAAAPSAYAAAPRASASLASLGSLPLDGSTAPADIDAQIDAHLAAEAARPATARKYKVRQGKDTSFRDEEEEEPLGATPCDKRCRIFCHLPATDDAESPARLKFGTPSKAARERQCGACSFVPLPSKKYSACNLPSSFLRIHLNTKKIIFDFWISI